MDTIRDNIKCGGCPEPSKRPVGFWDGEMDGGIMYDCESTSCPISQERQMLGKKAEERVQQAKAENAQRGINVKELEDARKIQQITVREMAHRLGISPSDLCDYQMERKAMPQEVAQSWKAAIEKQRSKDNE